MRPHDRLNTAVVVVVLFPFLRKLLPACDRLAGWMNGWWEENILFLRLYIGNDDDVLACCIGWLRRNHTAVIDIHNAPTSMGHDEDVWAQCPTRAPLAISHDKVIGVSDCVCVCV